MEELNIAKKLRDYNTELSDEDRDKIASLIEKVFDKAIFGTMDYMASTGCCDGIEELIREA